ncbi:hypothetical protein ACFO6R_09255 [Eubacterium multiforme]|uniref:O-antigen ligase like membrane protein n=1 Tax=Eubacterium multiforme TaxID=83339 RepID=A0ABT9UTB4_9FIRM|nr:hypothetical protein [Eubacterium multiforme]MDQ0149536.1 hypothetical protein [Eubacterium multiforme]
MKRKKTISIIEIVIPIFFILNQYNIGNLPLGLIVLIGTLVCHYFQCGKIKLYMPLVYLFGFMFLHDVIKVFIVPFNVGLWVERIVYFIFLLSIIEQVNEDNLHKVWRFVGIIAIIGIYIQSFQVYILHEPVSMIKIFPFLNSNSSNYLAEYMRPHSFFLEPAAYVTWILPLLYMSMERKKILFSVLISLSILLSTSSIGCFMTGIIWLYFAFSRKNENKKGLYKFSIFAILIIGVGLFFNLDIFSETINKLENISLNNTSNYVRIAFGIQLFSMLPIFYKVFGIPYSSIENYLRSGKVNLSLFGLNNDISYLGFVNAIGNCAINYGIFGLYFYLNLFYKLFKNIEKRYRCYLFLCFVSIFAQSVFWNSLFITQFSVLFGCAMKEKCKIVKWRN